MAGAHTKQHAINDTAHHLPGVNNTVPATVGGSLVGKSFGTAAVAGNLVDRDAGGHIVVPAGAAGLQAVSASDADAKISAAIDGLTVKAPVSVANVISDTLSAPPGGPASGDAYILSAAGSGGWAAFAQGDLVVWDGAAWQLVVANNAGAPADGLRVIVTGLASGVGAGSFAGQDLKIGTYSGGWTFETPLDGWSVLIAGDGDPRENQRFAYDTAPASWNLSQASVAHNSTTGLQGGGGGEFFHLTNVQFDLAVTRKASIALAGTEPAPGDLTTLANTGDWAFCQGTGRAIFASVRVGGSFFSVELSLVS